MIDQLEIWAKKWQVEFKLDKCEAMHFCKVNCMRKTQSKWQDPEEHRCTGRNCNASSLKIAADEWDGKEGIRYSLAFICWGTENKRWKVMLQLLKMWLSRMWSIVYISSHRR